MKRLVWLLVVVVVAVAVFVGRSVYIDARINAELTRLQMAESPEEVYEAAVEFLQSHPDLDRDRLDEAVGVLTNSAFESGDVDGLVSSLESLTAAPLSDRVRDRLRVELHDALVFRSLMAPKEGDVERADGIARDLLSSVELLSGSYAMMASLRSGMLADAPNRSTQWLTVELAWRAFGLSDAPTRAHETEALDGAVKALMGHAAAQAGVEAALAVADSVTAALRDPTLLAVLNANRYRLTVDESPHLARAFAGRLLDSPGSFHSWRILNELGVDIRNRELDHELALDLCEWALSLAPARADSQISLSSIGWIHHLMGNEAEAVRSLEASVALLDEAPTLGPSAVRRLLDVYEATGDLEPAIDLLASVVARSVVPDEDARWRLEDLLTRAGRDPGEVPELVAAHRYSGVKQAPEFEGVDASGDAVSLSQMRGKIVLLCFWSYG